jgi:hypothetical protein
MAVKLIAVRIDESVYIAMKKFCNERAIIISRFVNDAIVERLKAMKEIEAKIAQVSAQTNPDQTNQAPATPTPANPANQTPTSSENPR